MKQLNITYGQDNKKTATLVFNMMGAEDSLKFIMYIGKLLGGAAGKAISGLMTGEKGIEELGKSGVDTEKLGDLIPLIVDRIEEKETIEKINLLFSSVTHEGNVLRLDYLIFDGRPDLVFKIIKEAVLYNYSFFLNAALWEKLAATGKIIRESQTTPKNQM